MATRQRTWLVMTALLALSLALFPACASASPSLANTMPTGSCDAPHERPDECPRPGEMHPSAVTLDQAPSLVVCVLPWIPTPDHGAVVSSLVDTLAADVVALLLSPLRI